MRIAMWSGPRNISTAMMYSFAARGDCAAWDEPFYAPYLNATGILHPMGDEIVAAHENDPKRVAQDIENSKDTGLDHLYMKHMALHMLSRFSLDWAENCVNIHLIRHPARVAVSYAAKREKPSLDDIAFRQQAEIYEKFPGPVIDSHDFRRDPKGMLQKLCAMIGLQWRESMLTWQAGPKPYDGVWASHWYGAVHKSTGFAEPEGDLPVLETELAALADAAMPYYDMLKVNKI